jgi:hypothetical protein
MRRKLKVYRRGFNTPRLYCAARIPCEFSECSFFDIGFSMLEFRANFANARFLNRHPRTFFSIQVMLQPEASALSSFARMTRIVTAFADSEHPDQLGTKPIHARIPRRFSECSFLNRRPITRTFFSTHAGSQPLGRPQALRRLRALQLLSRIPSIWPDGRERPMHEFRVDFAERSFSDRHPITRAFSQHKSCWQPAARGALKLCADYEHHNCFRGFRASGQTARERSMHELRVDFTERSFSDRHPIARTFSQHKSCWQLPLALLGLRELKLDATHPGSPVPIACI